MLALHTCFIASPPALGRHSTLPVGIWTDQSSCFSARLGVYCGVVHLAELLHYRFEVVTVLTL